MNTPDESQFRNRNWLAGLLLLALVFIAYQPVWHAGFIWDDDDFLLNNQLIRMSDGLYRFWFTTSAPDYFPLTSTTLWLEWRLWGTNPLGYHVVNVLLHAISALLLWRLLARLKIPGAWLAAAIFALHPVNVESVAWITERKNTLAMVFYLFTFSFYLTFDRTRQSKWYWFAIGSFALALLSKTAVVMLPFVLLGIIWWKHGKIEKRDVLRTIPFFALALAMGLATLWFQTHRAIGAEAEAVRVDGWWSRIAGAGWAIWFYLLKAVAPLNLSFVYPRWKIDSSSVLVFAPALLLVGIFAICWHFRDKGSRTLLCTLGYFVLLLAPVLGFLNIYFMRYSLVADHWQYFAIIGPITLAAAGITTWCAGRRIPGAILSLLLILVLGGLTWKQSKVYQNVETLWADTLRKNPDCWLAHNNLGNLLLERGDLNQAIAHLQQAVEIEPDNPAGYNNLGNVFLSKGMLEEAMAQYHLALRLKSDDARAQTSLGIALLQSGNIDHAISCFQKALQIKPDYEVAHNNLGNAFLKIGRATDAIDSFRKALQYKPDYAEAHNNLGNALLQNGDSQEAIRHYEMALQLKPDNARTLNNLGNALLQLGKVDEAIKHLQIAVKIAPGYPDAHFNLGNASMQLGDVDGAIVHYLKTIEINPGFVLAHKNLAYVFAEKGDVSQTIRYLKSALKIRPEYPEVQNNLAWLLATTPQESLRNGTQAVELAEHANRLTGETDLTVLHTLAAAYAEAGRFNDALNSVHRAMELADATKQPDLIQQLNHDLKLYEAGTPFREEH